MYVLSVVCSVHVINNFEWVGGYNTAVAIGTYVASGNASEQLQKKEVEVK